MSGLLAGVAEGAIAGAAGGPIGMGIGAIGALVPSIAHLFFGNSKGVTAAAAAIQSAVGSTQTDTVASWMAANPAQAVQLQTQLATIAAQTQKDLADDQLAAFQAQLKDVDSARQQTVALANAHSLMAWGAGLISALVVIGFAVVCFVAFTQPIPAGSADIVYTALGTLGAAFMNVVGYWVGSSASSSTKDVAVQGAQIAAQSKAN
jgi:hypothetical protein